MHLTYKVGQNGHIGLYTASFTLANIFIVGVYSTRRGKLKGAGRLFAVLAVSWWQVVKD
jgi:hypothetical protein